MAGSLRLPPMFIKGFLRHSAMTTTLVPRLAMSSKAAAAEDQKKPLLYSFWSSSCSWRVRIVLSFKGIPFDLKPISLSKRDTNNCYTDEFHQINPMQRVPSLVIDGHTLSDSVAIMHYLEETRPEHPLLPESPYERAKVREIVEIVCSSIQPLQNVGVLDEVGDKGRLKWAQLWIKRGFTALESVLSTTSGKYSVGDKITLADVCLVPQVFNAKSIALF
ncbi:probable maleylacetoacetate isomerase 1 isoform X2 [Drosophila willistoni]|uniref:probable maleylacetoacetate isomerase 1 isoform X2 n=1 Tax=Drosophila willistoni TaxID=7260 RepID=UPI001F071385|nr:probable maleylacetoacetate isomerase 1 isoform X2 [Drosophila willistoni]